MSLYWIAPSLPTGTDWSCRSNRVMAFDTSKHLWSWDRCVSMSIQSISNQWHRNRNGSQRYCGLLSWSCFSNGFPRSYVVFFRGQHRFCHVFVNAIHDFTPRNGMVLKQRWYLNFDTVLIITIANFYVQDCADPCILANPSSQTSPLFISRRCVFST